MKEIVEQFILKGYKVHNKRILGERSSTTKETRNKDAVQETALIVDWLRTEHQIQIMLDVTFYDGFHYGTKYINKLDFGEIWKEGENDDIDGCDSPQEAYMVAFKYTLKNIL